MEYNINSQLNRGRVIYRPKYIRDVIEVENEMQPGDLTAEKDEQQPAAQNTKDHGKNTKKESGIKNP
jgi:hypothetical protein